MVNPEKQALLKDDEASMYSSIRAVNSATANGENHQPSMPAVAPSLAASAAPSTSQQNPEADDEATQTNVPSIGPGEVPPPYQQGTSGGVPMVTCRVCQHMIDITSKRDQHVVKCPQCNEATPIRNAPPGKKYVRCPCNCLLICKTISQRIACPRTNCKRIINLAPSPVTPPMLTMPGMCRVTCGHCSDTFLFNRMNKSFARCPHCRKVSSVGRRFALVHGCSVGVVSLIIFITGIGVTVGTLDYAATHSGMYVAYLSIFLIAACLLARSLYYFCLKISHLDPPM